MNLVDPWDGSPVDVDPYADVPPPDVPPWETEYMRPPEQPAPPEAAPPTSGYAHQIRNKLTTGSTILDVPNTVPAIWGAGDEVLWAQGEALMIVGPAGVGKTTITGQIVRARLGLGDGNVLGWPVAPSRRRVLYLAMDRPAQIRRSMGRLFTEDDREVLEDRLAWWSGPPLADMAQETDLLRQMAVEAGADTVIVDSLKDAAIGLSEDAVGAGYNRARQAAITAGIEVLELHHQRKAGNGGGRPDTLADVYGSTWITAGAGSVICLWGDAGDPIVQMTHLKQPLDEIGPLRILHDGPSGTSSVHHGTDLLTLACAEPTGITAKAAACAVYSSEKPTAAELEKVRRRLDALVRTGDLVKVSGQRGGAAGHGEARWVDALTVDVGEVT